MQPVQAQQPSLMNQFSGPIKAGKSLANNKPMLLVIGAVIVLVGIASGWMLSGGRKIASVPYSGSAPETKKSESEAGLSDTSSLEGPQEGTLEKGGIDGEGTHHLVRPGGVSQYIYLSSTVLDLESFVGKKVSIWGQTIAGKKAGWLMDVMKVKVSE